MPRETFEKFMEKLTGEKQEILKFLGNTQIDISNLKKLFVKAVSFSMKLATVWTSSGVTQKKAAKIDVSWRNFLWSQKWGISNRKINTIFQPIASLSMVSAENETGQTEIKFDLSSYVG